MSNRSYEVMKEVLRDISLTDIEFVELLDEITKYYEGIISKDKLSKKAYNAVWKWEFEMNRRAKYGKRFSIR